MRESNKNNGRHRPSNVERAHTEKEDNGSLDHKHFGFLFPPIHFRLLLSQSIVNGAEIPCDDYVRIVCFRRLRGNECEFSFSDSPIQNCSCECINIDDASEIFQIINTRCVDNVWEITALCLSSLSIFFAVPTALMHSCRIEWSAKVQAISNVVYCPGIMEKCRNLNFIWMGVNCKVSNAFKSVKVPSLSLV